MSQADDDGFLSRWSRRKAQARQGVVLPEPAQTAPPAAAVTPAAAAKATAATAPGVTEAPSPRSVDTAAAAIDAPPPPAAARPAPPTLADVAALTRESDFSRFVAPGVDGEVRNAALKKLFADPHYNVMDGLDIYIDDYTKPDPLPRSMLRKMAQAAALGLLDGEQPASDQPPAAQALPPPVPTAGAPAPDATAVAPPEADEDAALRLQPHDAAGCGGAEDGAASGRRQA